MAHEGGGASLREEMARHAEGVLDDQKPSFRWVRSGEEMGGCEGSNEGFAMPI
jgi:hypothetical protein